MTHSSVPAELGQTGVRRWSNRLAWDYGRAAAWLGTPVRPIVDAHAHISGDEAARVYMRVADMFGVKLTYTMTQLPQCEGVRKILGDRVRFIAFPTFGQADRGEAFRGGYLDTIRRFRDDFGAKMLKLWASPRLRDLLPDTKDAPYGSTDVIEVDAPWRVRACEAGEKLGMMFMIHIADPDTWFQAKYNKPAIYGTKAQQYEALERMLDRFQRPWVAAHMGGWPEDLGFLSGLLDRHKNLHLDTSATKWVVRALGGHAPSEVAAFFTRFKGRILFGSDVVVQEDHMRPQKQGVSPMADLADSPEAAFDLYASRYWALRAMFETSVDMESPIADPDLKMCQPEKYDDWAAPRLRGVKLPADVLKEMYGGVAERLFGA